MKRYVLPALVLAALSSSEAWAHTDHGAATGFVSGFAHPLSGLDHVLAMTTVGLWAGRLGRRAIIGLPASFLGAMVLGFWAALIGSRVPMIEVGITASVLGLGLAVLLNRFCRESGTETRKDQMLMESSCGEQIELLRE